MGPWNSLSGVLKIEITSASPTQLLNRAGEAGIALHGIVYQNALTVQCCIARREYTPLEKLVFRLGGNIKILQKRGIYFDLTGLVKRPIFLLSIILILILTVVLPTRVLFVRVNGNKTVADALILEKAEMCGVAFGAGRRELRSEQIKNALLSQIPQLQWVGVNTAGCVATISVRERSVAAQSVPEYSVGSIVAERDGILREMTIFKGNALCAVGQAVKEGQVLVSGYTDCGISIKAEMAEAEIIAQTRRELSAVTPVDFNVRGHIDGKVERYRLQIGKKSINLYKDSGIPDASCVRIYTKKYATLPGGFQLPFAVIKEELFYYTLDGSCSVNAADFLWMECAAESYLHKQMLAGKILQADYTRELDSDLCYQTADYSCLEMIGQVRAEESFQIDGKRD